MKNKLAEYKQNLTSEKNDINDALSQIKHIKQELLSIFTNAFNAVNTTQSIDEKIKSLGDACNSAVNWVELHETEVSSKLGVIDSKLSILNELIEHQAGLDELAEQPKDEDSDSE